MITLKGTVNDTVKRYVFDLLPIIAIVELTPHEKELLFKKINFAMILVLLFSSNYVLFFGRVNPSLSRGTFAAPSSDKYLPFLVTVNLKLIGPARVPSVGGPAGQGDTISGRTRITCGSSGIGSEISCTTGRPVSDSSFAYYARIFASTVSFKVGCIIQIFGAGTHSAVSGDARSLLWELSRQ